MKNKKNKALSIQVSLNGLSFCIKNQHDHSIEKLHSLSFKKKESPFKVLEYLNRELDKEKIFTEEFQHILLIHRNELSTLVPKPFFKESKIADYLKFNAKILRSDFISFDEIETIDCVNVYVPLININNAIIDRYGEFTYKHSSTILLETLLSQYSQNKSAEIFVHIENESFEIIVLENGSVLLSNSFSFNSVEDLSYYVLFTIEQLQLDPEKTPLRFLGGVNRGDENFEMLYKYIRDVDLIEFKTDTTYDKEISESDRTNNFILLHSFTT